MIINIRLLNGTTLNYTKLSNEEADSLNLPRPNTTDYVTNTRMLHEQLSNEKSPKAVDWILTLTSFLKSGTSNAIPPVYSNRLRTFRFLHYLHYTITGDLLFDLSVENDTEAINFLTQISFRGVMECILNMETNLFRHQNARKNANYPATAGAGVGDVEEDTLVNDEDDEDDGPDPLQKSRVPLCNHIRRVTTKERASLPMSLWLASCILPLSDDHIIQTCHQFRNDQRQIASFFEQIPQFTCALPEEGGKKSNPKYLRFYRVPDLNQNHPKPKESIKEEEKEKADHDPRRYVSKEPNEDILRSLLEEEEIELMAGTNHSHLPKKAKKKTKKKNKKKKKELVHVKSKEEDLMAWMHRRFEEASQSPGVVWYDDGGPHSDEEIIE